MKNYLAHMSGKGAQDICTPLPGPRKKASSRSELADHVRKDWTAFHSEKNIVEKERGLRNCEMKGYRKITK